MFWKHRKQYHFTPTSNDKNLPEGCTIYSTDFIIPAVNSFSSKLPIRLRGYQLDPFVNNSDPLIPNNFKIMSNSGLNNVTQMKSNFILLVPKCKLSPTTDVPIVDFMDTLKPIDNAYNNNFPLWCILCNHHLLYISCKSSADPPNLPEMC